MNKTEIKNIIHQHLQDNKKVVAQWDCGGDETLCSIFPTDAHGNQYRSKDLDPAAQELREIIVDELELPNAGEYYHNGSGKILINEQNQVVLEFTSKESINYWGDPEGYFEDEENLNPKKKNDSSELEIPRFKTYPWEDPFEMSQFLHRANLRISGEMDDSLNTQVYINLEITNGDAVPFSEEANSYYKQKTQEVLKEFIPTITYSKDQGKEKEIRSLYIEGILNPDHSIRFQLTTEMYELLKLHNEETIILIP